MARRHLTRRQPGWKKGLAINGTGAVLCLVVDIVIAVTKFTGGAWVILVTIPVLVAVLFRLNRQYVTEDSELEADAHEAATAPILRKHVVLVLVDRLDQAAARAIQYARTLMPDELRVVHFVIDVQRAEALAAEWARLGLSRVPLDLRECPDRVIPRAAILTVAEALGDGDTEVSVLLPDRKYHGLWHRILHDQTADEISAEVSRLPHANVTLVPFHLGDESLREKKVIKFVPRYVAAMAARERSAPAESETTPAPSADGTVAIGHVQYRQRCKVRGKVTAVRVQPFAGTPTLECIIGDGTGQLSVVFLGRRKVPGLFVGRSLAVEGVLGRYQGRLCILNPRYELLPG
jgi:hypothetical protein